MVKYGPSGLWADCGGCVAARKSSTEEEAASGPMTTHQSKRQGLKLDEQLVDLRGGGGRQARDRVRGRPQDRVHGVAEEGHDVSGLRGHVRGGDRKSVV